MKALLGSPLDWGPSPWQQLNVEASGPVWGVGFDDGSTWTLSHRGDRVHVDGCTGHGGFYVEANAGAWDAGIVCNPNLSAMGTRAGALLAVTRLPEAVGTAHKNRAALYALSGGEILCAVVAPNYGRCPLVVGTAAGATSTDLKAVSVGQTSGDVAVVSLEPGRDAIVACNARDGSNTIPLAYQEQSAPGAPWPGNWSEIAAETPQAVSALVKNGKVSVFATYKDRVDLIQQG